MAVSIRKGLPVKADWPAWDVYPVSLVEFKGVECLVEDLSAEPKRIEGLPLEFFCHELADVDPMSNREVIAFTRNWGVLHSPIFDSWQNFLAYRKREVFSNNERLLYKEADLDQIKDLLISEVHIQGFTGQQPVAGKRSFWEKEAVAVAQSKFVQNQRRPKRDDGGIIALEEVRRSLINLQETTRIFSYIDGLDTEQEILERIVEDYANGLSTLSEHIEDVGNGICGFEEVNNWVDDAGPYLTGYLEPMFWPLVAVSSTDCSNSQTETSREDARRFALAEAIAVQFYYELGDGSPWQTCGYSGCTRYFKYQRQNSVPKYLTSKKRGGTGFCCKSHSVMENRRLKKIRQQQR